MNEYTLKKGLVCVKTYVLDMLFLALAEGTLRSPILLLSLQELGVVLVGQKRMRGHIT